MNPLDQVELLVQRTASRLRWLRGWTGFWRGAVIGAALYLAALILFKVAPVPREWVTWAGWLAWTAPVIGGIWGMRRSTTPQEAARWLDERQGLQQRLSTALELGRQPASAPEPWRGLVASDASEAARQIDPHSLLPLRLPSVVRWVVLSLVLTVTLGFLPEYRTKAHQQAAKDAEVIREVGRELAQLSKRTLEQRPNLTEPVRQNVENVQELGERLGQVKLGRDDALKDLAKATEQLKQEASELARNPALRKMEKAARQSSGDSNPNAGALQKQMEALQKQLGEAAPDSEATRELQKKLDALQQAAKAMANNAGAEGQEARQQELANMANELARQSEALGLSLPSLDDAVAALNAAQVDQFLKHLETAEKDLEKLADMAREMARLQQQAERLGRDLGEQLQNGQAQAAIESLQRLQELLKQPGLSDEQKRSLAEELEKAVRPGDQYGKVGELLKQALSQARQNDKSGAGQSLAAAQKELEELLKDMGDMQALMASLEGLRIAQMAVGNCQSWGSTCRNGGAGKGGGTNRANRGFGDWADDSAWAMPDHISDSWDNTGLEQKDKDARGLTDRDASVPDNVAATKLKGKIQPGGSMPSITLKGVSLRGESKVAYTEAVQAAQTDAQSALNQEQVPKAYRNAVRDYFDDLKQ